MSMLRGTLLLLGLGFALMACADRTQKDQADREMQLSLAEIKLVSGPYRGILYSSSDNVALGAITITISPRSEVSSSNGPYAQAQASLKSQVEIDSGNNIKRFLTFEKGSFNPISKTFFSSVSVDQPDQNKTNIEISGGFSGETLTGEIGTADGRYMGRFELQRNAIAPDPQGLIGIPSPGSSLVTSTNTYSAQPDFVDTQETQWVILTFSNPQITPDQSFSDVFISVKSINLGVRMARSPLASITMPNAQWDYRTGSLRGREKGVGMDCNRLETASRQTHWDCTYFSLKSGVIFKGIFKPGSPEEQDSP